MKKTSLALVLALFLAACSSEMRSESVRLDYSQSNKITFATQDIRVVNRSRDPQPALSRQFQPRLADALSGWANDRLQSTGSQGHVTVIIKDASLTEQDLPTEKGFGTWFTRQQGRKYVARVEMVIEAAGDNATGLASAHAVQAVTLPEEPSADERQTAYKTVVEGVMSQFDGAMEQSIRKHLTHFIEGGQQ